jgi:hypothetical protein
MAKKIKRQSRTIPSVAVEYTSSAAAGGGRMAGEREFNPDYTYVIRDLRRIGVLAGSFFVILIALSFILPYIIH